MNEKLEKVRKKHLNPIEMEKILKEEMEKILKKEIKEKTSEMMNVSKITEQIAAGLRKCVNPPDYLIFINSQYDDETWNRPDVCGIPVFHTENINYVTSGGDDLNFIPVWKDGDDIKLNKILFEKGYFE